jgi:hypothetical protein
MTPDIGRIRAIKPAPHKQAGLGAVGWLLSILALGAVASLAGKLVPLYSDFSVMSNVLDGMAEEEGFIHRTDRMIGETIKKRFRVNGVRSFNIKDNIKINRTSIGVELVMDYEIRMDLIRNIDMIVSFDKTVELTK